MKPRPLAADDLDAVAALERVAFSDPWPRSAFAELTRESHVRGLVVDGEDGRLAGYSVCTIVLDEGEILNLAVAPWARRRGIARTLLAAMLRGMRAAGVIRVHLEVRESNEPAIRLYEAEGFERVRIRRDYYRNPVEHAVTMSRDLTRRHARK